MKEIDTYHYEKLLKIFKGSSINQFSFLLAISDPILVKLFEVLAIVMSTSRSVLSYSLPLLSLD